MAKKKSVTVPFPSNPQTAIDSNAAAKEAKGAIKLKPEHIAVMDTMLSAFEASKRAANEAMARANAYADQCATLCGVDPKDFELNWDLKAFVPKPKKAE